MINRRLLKYGLVGLLGAVAIAGGLNAVAPNHTSAQETSDGLTIFGGVESDYRLSYSIDRNEPYSRDARYYLEVRADKLPRAVTEIEISYPEKFTDLRGRFNENTIELRTGSYRGQESIPIDSAVWNQEAGVIEVYPAEPIPAETSFVIVLSNVNNPRRYGIHYFNLKLMYQGDVLRQYVGTWPLEVASE